MHRGWIGHLTLAAVCIVALAGCTSLDPKPDIQRASDTVAQRTGLQPAWDTKDPLPAEIPSPLTARDAAAIALRNDSGVRGALESIAAARADLAQSGLLPNPVLALDLGFPIAGSGGATAVGVSLTQQLAALLSRDHRMGAASAHLQEQVLAASDLALATVAGAKSAHARVLFTQRALDPLREAVGSSERAVQAAVQRVQAGEDTSLEVNRQRMALLRLRTELVRRETELALRKRELLGALGMTEASADFEVAPDPAEPSDPLASLTESDLIALIPGERLDVAAAQERARAAQAQARAEGASRIEFAAGADYERTDDGRDELGPVLEVSIPIFDTGDARVAKAAAEARRAAIEADAVRRRAIGQARAAYITASAAREQARRIDQEIVSLSDKNAALAQQAFDAGQIDLTVLLETQRARIEALVGLIDQQERAALALIELERAMGGRIAAPSTPEPAP